jgi:hypothetical protein
MALGDLNTLAVKEHMPEVKADTRNRIFIPSTNVSSEELKVAWKGQGHCRNP